MAETATHKVEDVQDYRKTGHRLTLISDLFDEYSDLGPDAEKQVGVPPDWSGELSVSCSS